MLGYDWPGNVRELSNCVQRMTAMNSGPLLHTEDLPSPLRNYLGMARVEQRSMAASAPSGPPIVQREPRRVDPMPPPAIMPLSEIEKRAILEALDYTKGDHSLAAQLLGIGRTTLYRKLKEYRLMTPDTMESKPMATADMASADPCMTQPTAK